jgi:hypothetical protein
MGEGAWRGRVGECLLMSLKENSGGGGVTRGVLAAEPGPRVRSVALALCTTCLAVKKKKERTDEYH